MKENYGETRDHIRAYLLMASYLGLLGDVYGSGKTIAIVAGILKYNPLPPKRHEDREENLSRMASWSCAIMERYERLDAVWGFANTNSEICSVLPHHRTLTEAQISTPTPLPRLAVEQGSFSVLPGYAVT